MNYDQNQIAFCILQQAAWMDRRPGESGPARFKRAMSAKGGTLSDMNQLAKRILDEVTGDEPKAEAPAPRNEAAPKLGDSS